MAVEGEENGKTLTDARPPEGADECPDAITLAAYLDSTMRGEELARMERHLARCKKCARDVSELRELLAATGVEPGRTSEVEEMVRRAKKLVGG